MARSIYKYNVQSSFIINNEEDKISSSMIKYFLVERLYEGTYMPVIYMSIAVPDSIYTKILEHEKDGKFYLNIRKYKANSNSPLYKDYIKGQFSYVLSTANPNYSEELGSADGESYKTVTVALLSMEILNLSKTSFNGIYGEIDQNTLISKALEGLKTVVKVPLYNATFETIIIPATNSKPKLLEFIFKENPFYDTPYMFFIDFDKAYLLDLTGDPIDAKDGLLNTIFIDIRSVKDSESYYEGIDEVNGAYQFFVNPANVNISPNKAIDKITNQLVFVDEDEICSVDLDINKNTNTTLKQTFIRSEDIMLYKNIAESNIVAIELVKENIDGSIITPNKKIVINNYADFDNFNGTYTIMYKKEIIRNINGDFYTSVSLGLKKVGNISTLGLGSSQKAISRNNSVRGKYTTTARKNNNNISRKSTAVATTNQTSHKSNTTAQINIPTVTRLYASEKSQSLKREIKRITG